jgi:hypothetical protein
VVEKSARRISGQIGSFHWLCIEASASSNQFDQRSGFAQASRLRSGP